MTNQAEPVRVGPGIYRTDVPTPAGGVYSIAYFSDAEGCPVDKAQASKVEIHEFDAQGRCARRTYGVLRGAGGAD
jgi:hypothetical protein